MAALSRDAPREAGGLITLSRRTGLVREGDGDNYEGGIEEERAKIPRITPHDGMARGGIRGVAKGIMRLGLQGVEAIRGSICLLDRVLSSDQHATW